MLRFLKPCFVFNNEFVCGNIYCKSVIVVHKILTFLMSFDEFGDEQKNTKQHKMLQLGIP